ncbi:hypothetical protein RJ640_005256 [Escallonia rubra]|uniref:Cyclic nucleotide-binding domain-containing protein n=1 Tax=Escallonia rubra TaxID=112253 RepID=A0AA88QST0_9ASTE|nr:hypothetical protein RJ640_005256 [Escallonia rubra]
MTTNLHVTPPSVASKLLNLPKPHLLLYNHDKPWWRQVLDPGSEFVNRWNHIFFVTCLSALFVDPLYFLLPQMGPGCMVMDAYLGVFVTLWRCVVDTLSFLHIAMKFRTAYVAPSSRVFGRGELVVDPRKIAKRYLKSDFAIDLAAALPLPQKAICNSRISGWEIVIWFIIPAAVTSPTAAHANHAISLVIILQSIPRMIVIFPLQQRIVKTTGLVAKTAWAGAAYNLALYLLASHESCFLAPRGMGRREERRMKTYLQSTTARLEEWRVRRRDTEEWMRHRQLPPDLQDRVRRFVQYKWLATRGVDEESILRSLPLDIRRQIQRHLCLALVRRVPFFSQMDDQLLDAICERLVSSLSTKDTYIVREGDPVNEMLFVIRGQLDSSTTNGGRSGFFNSITLKPGDFCGEELLTWALIPTSNLNLPLSTRTVRSLTEVEAFALRAEDLKFVAKQFKRLHSKKLQHAFRYYSHQWRSWGTCFIQAAWRRYKRKKMAEELAIQENPYYMQLLPDRDSDYGDELKGADFDESSTVDNNTQHLGATILASKFAANTRRGIVHKVKVVEPSASSLKMPKMFKPDEPDFSADHD